MLWIVAFQAQGVAHVGRPAFGPVLHVFAKQDQSDDGGRELEVQLFHAAVH